MKGSGRGHIGNKGNEMDERMRIVLDASWGFIMPNTVHEHQFSTVERET